MSAWFEAHVHTKAGSADSSISADALGQAAVERGTGGILVTEHFRIWSDWERDAFHGRWGVRVYRAMEATTDRGHIVVLGAPDGASIPADGIELLRRARAAGWFTILAHPFRHYFDRIHVSQRPAFEPNLEPDALASEQIFDLVDAVEIENGGCTDRENALAVEVATRLGKPVTVGSDAHHVHELGVIRTPVPEIPSDTGELIDLLSSASLKPASPGAEGRS